MAEFYGITNNWQPHESHSMVSGGTEAFSPRGTLRFYKVTFCSACGAKEWSHPAGRFADADLDKKCEVKSNG